MTELSIEQVDRLMLALDKLDAVLEHYDTSRKPRTKTRVVYRDPPDPKAVDLAALAASIERRLTLLDAARLSVNEGGVAPRCDRTVNNGMGEPTECGRTLPCEYHDGGGVAPVEGGPDHG